MLGKTAIWGFFLVFLYSLQFSCAILPKSSLPPWSKAEVRANLYPNKHYVQGFAMSQLPLGGNIETLMNTLAALARKELTESIQVKIKQTGTLTSREENNTVSSNYILKAQTESNFDISNIQTLKHYDKATRTGLVFAYALKEDLIRVYAQGLGSVLDMAQSYINQGNKPGLIIQESLRDYARATQILDSVQPKIKLLNTLGNKLWVSLHKDLTNQAYSGIAKNLANLRLQIHISKIPNPSGEFLKSLYQPIKLRVLNLDSLPMINIPLVFRLDGKIIGKAITDAQGWVSYLPNLLQKSKAQQRLTVSIDLASYLNTSEKIAKLSIFKPLDVFSDIILQITPSKIYLPNQEQSSKIVAMLQAFLVKHNFALVPEPKQARFMVQVDLQNHSNNQRNGIHFAYVDLRVKIYENLSKQTIFAKECINIKGADISQSQSIINAMQEAYASLEQELLNFVGL